MRIYIREKQFIIACRNRCSCHVGSTFCNRAQLATPSLKIPTTSSRNKESKQERGDQEKNAADHIPKSQHSDKDSGISGASAMDGDQGDTIRISNDEVFPQKDNLEHVVVGSIKEQSTFQQDNTMGVVTGIINDQFKSQEDDLQETTF